TGTQSFWNTQGLPRALALMQPPTGQKGASTPYVLCDSTTPGMLDWVYACTLEEGNSPRDCLPPNHIIKAAVGGRDQLFVVTYGAPLEGVTHPGDSIEKAIEQMTLASGTRAATQPATAAAATATAPITQPEPAGIIAATTTAAPAPHLLFNTFWYTPSPNTTATAPA